MKQKIGYSRTWHIVLPPAFLAFITTCVYYPSLHYNFQFDDIANISKHFDIRHYRLKGLFFSGTRWISYWLNSLHYKIGKFDPFSYRCANMLIHITNGILLFFLLFLALSRLKKDSFFKRNSFALAFTTALLFLLHPVQTQTISYIIQGQLEGLAMLCVLSLGLCFLGWTHIINKVTRAVFICFMFIIGALSCGTKEIAIISPLLLLLIDWFFVAQGSWDSLKKRLWFHSIFFVFIFGLYLYLLKSRFFTDILSLKFEAHNNIGNVITDNPNEIISPLYFFISQFKVILHYLWIFIWPFGISVEYDWKLAKNFFSPDCILPLMILMALGFIIYRLLRRNTIHPIAFGALWFALCHIPRSSIMPSPELLADYKTYMASVGWLFILATALVALCSWLIQKYKERYQFLTQPYAHYIFLLALALPLGFFTIQRNTVWRSGLDFWGNIIKNAPDKARAYNNYGVELSQLLGQFAESIPYFKQAIAMDKKYADPCNNLAVAYAQLGQVDNAIDALRQGLSINPYYPEGYNNIASFFLQKKDFEQAEKALQTALKLRPHYGKAYFNLGRLYIEKGEQEKGWECFKKCCTQADLDNQLGFGMFAKVSLSLKKYDDAIFAYKKVLELSPNTPDGKFNLANAYFFTKQFDQAATLYEQALQEKPNDIRVVYNLGETYFMLNRIQDALVYFEKTKASGQLIPQLYIRMASCYEKLGKPDKSKESLRELISKNIPPQLKNKAQQLMVQLDKKYPTHGIQA